MLRSVLMLSTLFIGVAQAQEAAVESYHYGKTLDIAQVVSIEAPHSFKCEAVTAVMTYLDSKGQERKLSYRKMSDGCHVAG